MFMDYLNDPGTWQFWVIDVVWMVLVFCLFFFMPRPR